METKAEEVEETFIISTLIAKNLDTHCYAFHRQPSRHANVVNIDNGTEVEKVIA